MRLCILPGNFDLLNFVGAILFWIKGPHWNRPWLFVECQVSSLSRDDLAHHRNISLVDLVVLLNRITWHLVGSKDTICSCAYYQESLISWILWELCPFELKHFPKYTTIKYGIECVAVHVKSSQIAGDQNSLVICTTTYGVLTTYQVSCNSVQ
jgi:hypothetical protein